MNVDKELMFSLIKIKVNLFKIVKKYIQKTFVKEFVKKNDYNYKL